MTRKWHVEMVYHVELIRLGRLCDDIMHARPDDAGPSDIERVKIRPIDSELGIAEGYVSVLARGTERDT